MAALKKGRLVFLEDAITVLNEAFSWNPAVKGRNAIALGTLYNAINKKRLTRYGTFHKAQVDVEELLREFGPKRK